MCLPSHRRVVTFLSGVVIGCQRCACTQGCDAPLGCAQPLGGRSQRQGIFACYSGNSAQADRILRRQNSV